MKTDKEFDSINFQPETFKIVHGFSFFITSRSSPLPRSTYPRNPAWMSSKQFPHDAAKSNFFFEW